MDIAAYTTLWNNLAALLTVQATSIAKSLKAMPLGDNLEVSPVTLETECDEWYASVVVRDKRMGGQPALCVSLVLRELEDEDDSKAILGIVVDTFDVGDNGIRLDEPTSKDWLVRACHLDENSGTQELVFAVQMTPLAHALTFAGHALKVWDLMTPLQRELSRRAVKGHYPVSADELEERLQELGYRLDLSMCCASDTQHQSGPGAGDSYPATTTVIKEIDTGRSFSHVDARRDANHNALLALRGEQSLFCIVKNTILSV